MVYYIGNNFFKFVRKPRIEGFNRTQVTTLGTKGTRKILCTLLYDGETIADHNINLRSFYDKRCDQLNVAVRSNQYNIFDSMVIIFAVPFNGRLYPPKNDGFRYRNMIIIPVTDKMQEDHPELKNYDSIFYGIVEVHTSRLDPSHANTKEKIFINVIYKTDSEPMGKNFSIVVSKQITNDKNTKFRIGTYTITEWRVAGKPDREIPWDAYADPRVKKRKRATTNKKKVQTLRKKENCNAKTPTSDTRKKNSNDLGMKTGGYTSASSHSNRRRVKYSSANDVE